MNRNYALTYIPVNGQLYKPGEMLPDTLSDKEWKRLMQKRAIRYEHDPVATIAEDMESEAGADEQEANEGETPTGQTAEKAAADTADEKAKAKAEKAKAAKEKAAAQKAASKAAKQEEGKAAPPVGAASVIK